MAAQKRENERKREERKRVEIIEKEKRLLLLLIIHLSTPINKAFIHSWDNNLSRQTNKYNNLTNNYQNKKNYSITLIKANQLD